MREWRLRTGDPLCLTLAADARLGKTNYFDDHSWELSIGGGEPLSLALQTTFGLRAKAFRLFPRFSEGELTKIDPADFSSPPIVTRLYPNLIVLHYAPFPGIDVESEYWVPQSDGLVGRFKITNLGKEPRQIKLELLALLTPVEGQRMAVIEIQAAPVLVGNTADLSPLVFLTGGPETGSGSYPSLLLSLELPARDSQKVTWSHAACSTPQESFDLARKLAARKLDAERAKIELLNSSVVEIFTGDADWDNAFNLSQKQALELFMEGTKELPFPSFVISRQPDLGYSLRGDGSDYNFLWNGQSPQESYYLAGLLLPGFPELLKGLILNFLSVQEENGFIDWKPGLSGQRSHFLATPLLTNLCWRVYEITGDRSFLQEIFYPLMKFIQVWFSADHDRDRDGIPEWDHPLQSVIEDHPLYARWHPWSQGIDMSTAESPALCAFLYQECLLLARIARLIGHEEEVTGLQSQAETILAAVQKAWDPAAAIFHDWDRDTHTSPETELLGQRLGSGEIWIQKTFDSPIRLMAQIITASESTRRPQLVIRGTGVSKLHRIERISDDRFRWYFGRGNVTCDRVYTEVEQVEIQGVDIEDQVELYKVGYRDEDLALLLPIWAEMMDAEDAQLMVEKMITCQEKFWRPYGLPSCPETDPQISETCQNVLLPLNSLIGEGLLNYGYRDKAADLVTRLMTAVIKTLKSDGAFRRNYNSETGQGTGERNPLNGLAPLGLFMKTLGVQIISPVQVGLSGYNPFPWPVTVKYRGLTIMRQKEKTVVIFPDGQMTTVTDPQACIVSLKSG